MRIVYVTSMLPFGPMEAFIAPEIEALRERGHSVLVVPMHPRGPALHYDVERWKDDTRREPLFGLPVLLTALKVASRRPRPVAAALWRLRGTRGPKLIAQNLAVVPKGLWLSEIAVKWRADHIHAHWASATASLAYIAHSLSGIPWSFTAHRYDIYQGNLLGLKMSSAAFARAISDRGARDLEEAAGNGAPRVHVVHMGVRVADIRSSVPVSGPFRVIVAANLREVKGHIYLIRALRILRDRGVAVQADFAGEGPERTRLEAAVKELGLAEDIRFLGVLPHDVLLERMRAGQWNAAVLPSIAVSATEQEGIPVFLMESMAMGLPVVSTTTGCISELLDRSAGVLVPDRDPSALADALGRLVSDVAFATSIADAGKRKILDDFSVDAVVERLIPLFSTSIRSGAEIPNASGPSVGSETTGNRRSKA